MTAVVAQMTREQRERKSRQRHPLSTDSSKCFYKLRPFDPHFEPEVHNKFMAGQLQERQFNELRQEALRVKMRLKDEQRRKRSKRMWWTVCIIESIIIGFGNKNN